MYPKISVITPSYNQGKYLEETITSVVNQDYPNLEFIIIDGGSSDESVNIIKKYESKITFWQSKPDKGQSNAINIGFAKATGDILCWLNSDDTFLPNALHDVAENYIKTNFDFYYSDVFLIDSESEKFGHIKARKTNYEAQVCGHFAIPQQGSFWTPDLFNKAGGLNESNKTCMDGELFMNFLKNKDIKVIKDNVPTANFRIHPESLTGSSHNKVQYKKDRNELVNQHIKNFKTIKKIYYKYVYRFIA